VLLRAAKLNGMGRNLDLGSDYTVRGGKYVDRAIKIQPDSAEANFLYGMMLSEGGGFKEGQKYLDRAVSLGYTEAEQSLAQSDLLSDRRDNALERLRRLEEKNPNNDTIRQQIKLIEEGKFYIWDIPAPNINVKPTV
jgi:Tfp pilus assembly protein PilF